MQPAMDFIMQQPSHAAGSSNVPAFLAKLWKMVDDPETNHLIAWSDEGQSFVIHNQADFAQSLLPFYYKHSNMASFVRQLNMYGFHKVVGVDTGGLKSERQDEMEFAHQFFIRGNEPLLEKIKRKVSTNKGGQFVPAMKTERVNEVLNEVSMIKDKQEDLDGKLETMKKENEALWTEVVSLRQKHQSQQKIVNKLIQFLVSIVQPRMAVKRRYPTQLAIEDVPFMAGNKDQRLMNTTNIKDITDIAALDSSGQATVMPTVELPTTPEIVVSAGDNTAAAAVAPAFPLAGRGANTVIGNPVRSAAAPPVNASMQPVDPTTLLNPVSVVVAAPPPPSSSSALSNSGATAPPSGRTTTTSLLTVSPKRPVLHRELSREDIDYEMNLMQSDLDKVKDILSSQVTLDSSVISNLFSPEEPLLPDALASTSELPKLQMESKPAAAVAAAASDTTPSLFELADIDEEDDPNTAISVSAANAAATANKGSVDLDLNTPMVLTDNQNPLLTSLRK